jgi:hypothetical protein
MRRVQFRIRTFIIAVAVISVLLVVPRKLDPFLLIVCFMAIPVFIEFVVFWRRLLRSRRRPRRPMNMVLGVAGNQPEQGGRESVG